MERSTGATEEMSDEEFEDAVFQVCRELAKQRPVIATLRSVRPHQMIVDRADVSALVAAVKAAKQYARYLPLSDKEVIDECTPELLDRVRG